MSEHASEPTSSTSSTSARQAVHHTAPKASPKPTDGASQDDRFGEGPIAVELPGRVIGVSVEHGQNRILIGVGSKHGVRVGMPGHVTLKEGRLSYFQIDEAREMTCFAFITDPLDHVQQGTREAVINPRSML